MPAVLDATERCGTCGGDASGGHAYCHFYLNGEPRAFCSPDCAELALFGDEAPGPGARRVSCDPIARLIETLRWEHWS